MMRVGLTGGIAAGKSVVSRRLTQAGVPVVDYDHLARMVVAPGTEGLQAVLDRFGVEMLADDGTLNRSRLAERVFGDDDARDALEAIIHPLVIAWGHRLDQEADDAGEEMIVHDIPLLVEAAGPDPFDAVIVVDADPEVRARRLVVERGMTEDEAWERIDAQIDDEVRRDAADIVFDGSGTVENLDRQVDEWLAEVRSSGMDYRPTAERTKFLVTEDGIPDTRPRR